MTVDPDGCTFWYTNEYFAATGLNFLTRIGSFKFATCTPVGAGGTVQGTVTASVGGAPISGATVALGARTTTTSSSGAYSFTGSPGDVKLSKPDLLDQQNSNVNPLGLPISNTSWAGQTFTPAIGGQLVRADIELFCSGCTTAGPNITVSIRATTGATPIPTG